MKIGICSDTHGHQGRTLAAVTRFKEHDVACVLHCGDIGTAEIVQALAAWPGHFVAGNVDQGIERILEAAMAAEQKWHNQFADLTLAGRRIAIAHGHDQKRLETAMICGDYDLVCCGHTHQQQVRQIENTLVINPGALYRTSTPSCAVVDLVTLAVEICRIA